MTDPIKPGLRKLHNNTKQPEAWLVIISWNMGCQKRFVIIAQVRMELSEPKNEKVQFYNKVDLRLRVKHA